MKIQNTLINVNNITRVTKETRSSDGYVYKTNIRLTIYFINDNISFVFFDGEEFTKVWKELEERLK